MKRHEIAGLAKNAVSTVFLLAGAFFVCSTFLSMRAVFADPIAPTVTPTVVGVNSPRANATSRASARSDGALRVRGTTPSVSRETAPATATRNVVSRATATRNNTTRGVVSRNNNTRGTVARNVVARTTQVQTPSRVSLSGSAIRGNYGAAATNTYTYLSNKLYSGNYSNIIDSTTGLISAEAYQNCLESYYTCMDEICTARSAAKRRCSCAARVTKFIEAEEALNASNEELIKASGELALLIANKGKDVSEAFQLTDAEKVMNCVSWQETKTKYGENSDELKDWCANHMFYGDSGSKIACSPSYCSASGNTFGFDIKNIEGSGSDILATLQAWADAKDKSLSYVQDDTTNLLSAYQNISFVVSDLTGIATDTNAKNDSLANTWGYELFGYAHNNVCGRVLDACFNGIYEGCGTPPTNGRCANGASSSCPYNFNSKITISNTGDVALNERNSSTTSMAACFGYTTTTTTNGVTTTTDPYASLRGPVADARRSVMQKYLLDANADCDTYGEELKATAQNVSYQKIAAQQALQQKRLEFKNEAESKVLSDATNAITNFTTCIDEIYDCYATMLSSHGAGTSNPWTTARINTYCAQMSQVPHCYEEMVCNPSYAQFKAVVDKADSTSCDYNQDYSKNTCRNIVTLNEILNGAATKAATGAVATTISVSGITSVKDSAALRELCLQDALGISTEDHDPQKVALRTWVKDNNQ